MMHPIDALFVLGIVLACYAVGGLFWAGIGLSVSALTLGVGKVWAVDN